jgi:hypothetical protein
MSVEVSPFLTYLSIAIIGGFCILLFLFVRESDEYTVEEMDQSAQPVSDMQESRGRVTVILWIMYIALTAWALTYLYLHWAEFVAFP